MEMKNYADFANQHYIQNLGKHLQRLGQTNLVWFRLTPEFGRQERERETGRGRARRNFSSVAKVRLSP